MSGVFFQMCYVGSREEFCSGGIYFFFIVLFVDSIKMLKQTAASFSVSMN